MKSFIAIATLAFATIVAANPAPVEKRQVSLPSIICIPSGSLLSVVTPIISSLPVVPSIITCTAPETCTALPIISDVPLLGGLVGICE